MFETVILPLVAGAVAGLSVDVVLFPLDTIKTRFQSSQGFWKAGGFHKLYSGLGSLAVGSTPSAATFFCTYELVKRMVHADPHATSFNVVVNMVAAGIGELTSNGVRVPFEMVKQRAQANKLLSSVEAFKFTLQEEGFKGFYRGYWSTVFREVPFSFIQYPLWEYLKIKWSKQQKEPIQAWQSAVCGSLSGGVAAALTTPLDVTKTRIMLAEKDSPITKINALKALILIGRDEGIKRLFSGILPRVLWISIGGAIFLGVYDQSKMIISRTIHTEKLFTEFKDG
ncbi:S-adenosylmethionine mitochondrial carrier protein-like [Xenia sp. Carnegie-2017]|uniref:S-adenosylmethionine mitochondrial carrier protein-like n=1 Tax=Xenia sp. Carnegie-2017 TaxID=2897299 RepID=UPI001F044DDD|nr:S-adenosylmethionine mitochondrial carrier protein-like [Xenia sp. Carnegie-2017]